MAEKYGNFLEIRNKMNCKFRYVSGHWIRGICKFLLPLKLHLKDCTDQCQSCHMGHQTKPSTQTLPCFNLESRRRRVLMSNQIDRKLNREVGLGCIFLFLSNRNHMFQSCSKSTNQEAQRIPNRFKLKTTPKPALLCCA